jgi:hypothetical protein
MTDPHPHIAQLRLQLAEIALSTIGMQERAAAVLETLGRVLPFDAAWLAVRDPEQHRHTPLATSGPADPLRRYFSTPDADVEVERLGLNHRRPPMLASESPVPLPELRAWAEHLLPAGFRGGLAAGLFTPSGRHVGFLSLLTEDPARPDVADRQLIATVAGIVAHGLDRAQEMADTARIVQAAGAGVVLTRGGETEPLPGLPGHRLLVAGSAILTAAAAELADGDTYRSFLTPPPAPTARACSGSPPSTAPAPTSTTSPPQCCSPHPVTYAASPRETCGCSACWPRESPSALPSRPAWASTSALSPMPSLPPSSPCRHPT